jgi:hypothetical protein
MPPEGYQPQPAPVTIRPPAGTRPGVLGIAMVLSSLVLVGGVSFAVGRLTAPSTGGSGSGANTLPGAGLTGARRVFGAPGQVDSNQAAQAAASQAPDAQAPAASPDTGTQGGGVPGGGQGFPGGGRGLGGTPSLIGTVTSIGDASITIQLESGQALDVATGDATQYHQQQPIDRSQITVGAPVQVQVDGLGGFGGRFPGGGQGGPAASAAPGQPGDGSGQLTATDVTVLEP